MINEDKLKVSIVFFYGLYWWLLIFLHASFVSFLTTDRILNCDTLNNNVKARFNNHMGATELLSPVTENFEINER